MKKNVKKFEIVFWAWLFLTSLNGSAFGLLANLNDDCVVNLLDYAIFAADWQSSSPADPNTDFNADGTVDINDLAIFVDQWLEYKTLDRVPVCTDQSTHVFNSATKTITLAATDADSLTYSVQSLPTSGQGVITGISSVPTDLASNTFVFDPCDTYTGTVTIVFGADDGSGLEPPCGGLGTGTVTIEVHDDPINPDVNPVAATVVAYVQTGITLDGDDDGWPDPPGKIRYIITSLPTDGTLQDPHNGYFVIGPNNLPYTISGWENDALSFVSDTVGMDSFNYKVNDGENDSNTVAVDVNVIANLNDSLDFDGDGYVTFADQSHYDITDGWAIDFWIKTQRPFEGLIKKRGTTGKGYEIGIVSGKPKLYLYDASGEMQSFRYQFRIDDGQWHNIGFVFNYDDPNMTVEIRADGGEYVTTVAGISDYSNSEPLIVGLHARDGYKYEFDKLRFFSGVDVDNRFHSTQGLSYRAESGGEVLMGIGFVSDVLFMLDEGSGTTVTDSKLSYTGTFNDANHVFWTPEWRLFQDASVGGYFIGGGQ
ncbi:MAG: hypothetical protein DRP56_02055 [Planctomycetota bacterium]|nr:MAG: hypothetical protein DRP56_02055 [Planctomycetota bacterium]